MQPCLVDASRCSTSQITKLFILTILTILTMVINLNGVSEFIRHSNHSNHFNNRIAVIKVGRPSTRCIVPSFPAVVFAFERAPLAAPTLPFRRTLDERE